MVFSILSPIIAVFFLLFSQDAFSLSPELSRLENSFQALIKSGTKVAAMISNLETGEKLLEFHSETPLNPASTIKLFAAYAALKRLGPAFTFKTEVWSKPDQGICVRGGGDPSFVMEDLYLLIQHLKRKGIDRYSGEITLDSTAFDEEFYPGDRTDQDSERAYNAPISALNFNYNTISVFVSPREKGEAAVIGLDFPFDFVKVKGKVMTGNGTEISWDKVGKEDLEIISLGGKIAVGADEWRKPFRIRNPAMAFGEAMSKLLTQAGIQAKSKIIIRTGVCNHSLEPALAYESKPLSYVVELMDKYSNNFIADSLIKTLDHELNQKQGTTSGGIKIVREEMKKFGIDLTANGRNFVSGSGLTRDNRVSANDFIKLLSHVNQEKLFLPELLSSLPIASLDGTLKRKYVSSPVALRLRAKTGSLNDVQSLVGVYPNQKGKWLGIAIIVNGPRSIPEKELGNYLFTQ